MEYCFILGLFLLSDPRERYGVVERTASQVSSRRERLEPAHFLWYILGGWKVERKENNQWDKVLVQVKTRGSRLKALVEG